MKILFAIKSLSHFPYVSSVVDHLARNNNVTLLFDSEASKYSSPQRVINSGVDVDWLVRRSDKYRDFLFAIREIRSYRNYLGRNQSSYYTERWGSYIPQWANGLKSVFTNKACENIERNIAPDKKIIEHIQALSPDVIIATPCNHRHSEEIEYIKAAKFLGIPCVIATLSWDNLTTKGLFHIKPDMLLVWNGMQRREAISIHDINPDTIRITGSPFFDKWDKFKSFTDSRYVFCKQIGLDLMRPYFLYVGSSANIAEDERWIIDRIVGRFDLCNILFRPHPANYRPYIWMKKNGVVVFPQQGTLDSTYDFYRSMFHAKFVFGINTSGMIDAIVVNKPCVTLLVDQYSRTQSDAIHFKPIENYICSYNNIDEMLECFKALLNGIDGFEEQRKEFVETYIRPVGVPAGEASAEAIYSLLQ